MKRLSCFHSHPKIARALSLLNETGLGSLKRPGSRPTLSRRRSERLKLVPN